MRKASVADRRVGQRRVELAPARSARLVIELGREGLAQDVHRFQAVSGGVPLTRRAALEALRGDATFRSRLTAALAAEPFDALRFELPALSASGLDEPFEFVTVADRGLAVAGDPRAFREHFERAADQVLVFANLGGDARLVVPRPLDPTTDYAHLAAFCRSGPEAQQQALWRAVGVALQERVGERPVWLSTAGGGVPWLHVRLDDRPKYYAHAPYRRAPGAAAGPP